jgi:HEPN domain-containing protein
LEAAKVLVDSGLLNPCLHNIQQSIEKSLKALLTELHIPIKKTHSILELKTSITTQGILLNISDDDCDLIDSIYLPTKYPMGSSLPYFYPDKDLCQRTITLCESVFHEVTILIENLQ